MASSYEKAKRKAKAAVHVDRWASWPPELEPVAGVSFDAGVKWAMRRLREMARQWEKEAADRAPVSLQRACDADQRAMALERAADLLEREAAGDG